MMSHALGNAGVVVTEQATAVESVKHKADTFNHVVTHKYMPRIAIVHKAHAT